MAAIGPAVRFHRVGAEVIDQRPARPFTRDAKSKTAHLARPWVSAQAMCGNMHRANVDAYRQAKADSDQVRMLAREFETVGHTTEGRQWDETHPPPLTFKQWLRDGKRPREVA